MLPPLSTFIICHTEPDNNGFAVLHYVTPLRVLSEPCAPEEHSSESGSEKQEKINTNFQNGIGSRAGDFSHVLDNPLRPL